MSEVHTPLTGARPPTGNPGHATADEAINLMLDHVDHNNKIFVLTVLVKRTRTKLSTR